MYQHAPPRVSACQRVSAYLARASMCRMCHHAPACVSTHPPHGRHTPVNGTGLECGRHTPINGTGLECGRHTPVNGTGLECSFGDSMRGLHTAAGRADSVVRQCTPLRARQHCYISSHFHGTVGKFHRAWLWFHYETKKKEVNTKKKFDAYLGSLLFRFWWAVKTNQKTPKRT